MKFEPPYDNTPNSNDFTDEKKRHPNPHHVDFHVDGGLIKYAANVLIDTQQKFILNAVHKYILQRTRQLAHGGLSSMAQTSDPKNFDVEFPVKVFEKRTLIERYIDVFGFAPAYLGVHAKREDDPFARMKCASASPRCSPRSRRCSRTTHASARRSPRASPTVPGAHGQREGRALPARGPELPRARPPARPRRREREQPRA